MEYLKILFTNLSINKTKAWLIPMLVAYSSDPLPRCRGTQGCHEEVLGVPPIIDLSHVSFIRVPRIAIFCMLGCYHFFSSKGCREPQEVEKCWLKHIDMIIDV
jgi:hypothetical protein